MAPRPPRPDTYTCIKRMSEDQWDDDVWVDDEYNPEDEVAASFLGTEGFPGYVPTTTDPGPWVFVLVAGYTLFLMMLLPALVIWGRRYEERRKAERAAMEEEGMDEDADGADAVDGAPNTPETQCETPLGRDKLDKSYGIDGMGVDNGSRGGGRKKKSSDDFFNEQGQGTSFTGDGAVEGYEVDAERSSRHLKAMTTPTKPPSRVVRQRSDNSHRSRSSRSNLEIDRGYATTGKAPGPKSAVSGAGTAVSGTTGTSGAKKVFEGAFDKFFIPPYQDDDAEIRTYLSGAVGQGNRDGGRGGTRSEAAASAATTSMMRRDKKKRRKKRGVTSTDDFESRATDFNAGRARRRRGTTSDDSSSVVSGATGLHGRKPRIIDAAGRPGVGGGRRGARGRAARRGIGRAGFVARAVADEERSELSRSSAGWVQRERIMAEAGGGQMNPSAGGAGRSDLQSGMSASPSELRRRKANGQGQAGSKNVSDAASSVLTGDEQESAMKVWAQAGRRRLGAARSALSGQNGPRSALSAAASETPSIWKTQPFVDDISPNDAADADDPGQAKPYRDDDEADVTVCCGPMALWRPKTVQYGLDYLIELCEPDAETKRLVRLGIPLTCSEVAEAFFDTVTVAVIAQFLGTNEVTAYVVVQLLVGMTDELINGVIAAESTVCSHAVGSGRNHLAGQYVQISVVVYIVFSIPLLLMWVFVVDDVMMFLGLSEVVAKIGLDYTRVVVFHYLLEGVHSAFSVLLDITDHEMFGMWLEIAEGIIDIVAVSLVCVANPDTDLVTIGFLHLVVGVFFFVLTVAWALCKGWMSAFWGGMLGSFALKNSAAVKNLLATAIPLSLGSFLEYGEWEMLTFFIAYLGPAEVATWGILGSIWELFEASTEGLGEAAAIRVAYHLGKGNPIMARVSSYKSMLLSTLLSVFITSVFFMCGQNLPTWFTSDPTLQHMLNDLIPLVGFGNITMTAGMVCWSLVGAQGRYRLSTLIVMVSSWLVTLPLAALFVFGLTITLKGIVGAVIMGYSTAATALLYVILRSDWARLSKIIQELNAMTGEVDSSDDEDDESSDESSSSSSSSSSSNSSDDDSSSSSSDSSEDSSESESELEASAAGSRLSRHIA